jgi:asparagine N-glycosylation enzyme membrane subunit Stt3
MMTQSPTNNVVEVKPAPTVYTVLILISLIALVTAIFVAGRRLTASPDNRAGYGLGVGEILKPWEEIQPRVDSGRISGAAGTRRPSH